MVGLVGQRAVQGDEITLAEQGIQIHVVDALHRVHIIGNDFHAEATADVDKHAADTTGSYDTDSLAVQVHAGQTIQAEVELTGTVVRLMGLAVQGQQEGHGMLCYRMRGISWYTDSLQVAQGLQIQVVVACAAHGYQLYAQLLQLVQNLCVDGIIYKGTHHVAALRGVYGLGIELMLHVTDINFSIAVPFSESLNFIRFCIEKRHFNHNISSCTNCSGK